MSTLAPVITAKLDDDGGGGGYDLLLGADSNVRIGVVYVDRGLVLVLDANNTFHYLPADPQEVASILRQHGYALGDASLRDVRELWRWRAAPAAGGST